MGGALAGCDGFGGPPVVVDAAGGTAGHAASHPGTAAPAPAPAPYQPSTPVAPVVRDVAPRSTEPAPADRIASERTGGDRPSFDGGPAGVAEPGFPSGDGRIERPTFDDPGPTAVADAGTGEPDAGGPDMVGADGGGAESFDPPIDPSTLEPPAPAVADAGENAADGDREPELQDHPITGSTPPRLQSIPDDLALPSGTVLVYQDAGVWVEVELKADAPPVNREGGEDPLRVHRTDRPKVIPDFLLVRDQALISKLLVRRLTSNPLNGF